MRHLHPEDAAALLPHRRGEAVDRRHDVARRRNDGVADRLIHKGVLQVDDDERGAGRIKLRKAVLGAAALDDAADDLVGDGSAIELHGFSGQRR